MRSSSSSLHIDGSQCGDMRETTMELLIMELAQVLLLSYYQHLQLEHTQECMTEEELNQEDNSFVAQCQEGGDVLLHGTDLPALLFYIISPLFTTSYHWQKMLG